MDEWWSLASKMAPNEPHLLGFMPLGCLLQHETRVDSDRILWKQQRLMCEARI